MIYNNVKTLKLGDKRVLRVINKEKAVFPNAVKDGLILWYDLEGYTNQNVNREVAHDYSGNGRNGSLENFLFDAESGYNNGLIFDGVDDFIQLPELNLDVDDYSVQLNDKIYSFRGEQVAHTTQSDIDTAIDAVEVGGRNLADWGNIIKQGSYENIGGNKYLLNPKRVTDGFKPKTDKLIIGDEAVLSYKIKYISGYIANFGGHCYHSITKILVDGVAISRRNYHEGLSKSYIEDGEEHLIQIFFKKGTASLTYANIGIELNRYYNDPFDSFIEVWDIKLEKGNKAADWTPAPEDLLSTQFKTTEKLKSLRYWNRALTDSELLTMYNIEKKR